MRSNCFPLIRGELVRSADDVGERAIELSDVVIQRYPLSVVALWIIEIGRISNDQRVPGNAPDMRAGNRTVCLDAVEQSLERCRAEPRHVAPRATLSRIKGSRGCRQDQRRVSNHGGATGKKRTWCELD